MRVQLWSVATKVGVGVPHSPRGHISRVVVRHIGVHSRVHVHHRVHGWGQVVRLLSHRAICNRKRNKNGNNTVMFLNLL